MDKIKVYLDGPNIPIYVIENLNYESTSEELCDCIISCYFPWGCTDHNQIQNALNIYKNTNKKVYVFLITDSYDQFIIPSNVLFYRTSLLKSLKLKNDFILPFVWRRVSTPTYILPKTLRPIIGFCGQISVGNRKKLLKKFDTDEFIQNYIIRDKFWAGKKFDAQVIKEFEDNILSSHFTLCNSGTGNFSMRFYQVLSAGRIPILVNTDLVFPFDTDTVSTLYNKINWDEIIILGDNEDQLVDKVLDWWKNKDIESIQVKCKEIYDQYFNEKTFFNNLIYHKLTY
jgi:hypothetical protein